MAVGSPQTFGVLRAPVSEQQYHIAMQLTTGTVVDGKVVIEGLSLTEGSSVIVITEEPDDSLSLSPAQEEELLLAIAEMDRGEGIPVEEFFQSLDRVN